MGINFIWICLTTAFSGCIVGKLSRNCSPRLCKSVHIFPSESDTKCKFYSSSPFVKDKNMRWSNSFDWRVFSEDRPRFIFLFIPQESAGLALYQYQPRLKIQMTRILTTLHSSSCTWLAWNTQSSLLKTQIQGWSKKFSLREDLRCCHGPWEAERVWAPLALFTMQPQLLSPGRAGSKPGWMFYEAKVGPEWRTTI